MNFIGNVLRFLFWLLVLSWGVRVVRYLLRALLRNAEPTPSQAGQDAAAVTEPGTSRRLVRDPVCGMHVDETMSIPLRVEGELVHFCSVACRDRYAPNDRKLAANG